MQSNASRSKNYGAIPGCTKSREKFPRGHSPGREQECTQGGGGEAPISANLRITSGLPLICEYGEADHISCAVSEARRSLKEVPAHTLFTRNDSA
jgi:hypothetical protein